MPNPLQVTLATISRFATIELAAQLERYHALEAVYTGLARHFVRTTRVAPHRIRTFPWIQTPLEAAQRLNLVSHRVAIEIGWYAKQALDCHIAKTLHPCHVYCALSGIGLASGKVAKEQGAVYVCNRLSSHILHQDRILREEFESLGLLFAGIDHRILDKECAEYEQADTILVPSAFARDSFLEMGLTSDKVHAIPFGVDTGQFKPSMPRDEVFRVLFVGQLSVRKGLHYLLQAYKRADLANATLVLVGEPQSETKELLDRFPVKSVELLGTLTRREVAEQMSRASAFVLPSIEEGLAQVLVEALACGCPVIASRNTGATDLFNDGEEGWIVPVGSGDEMASCLIRLYDDPTLLDDMSRKAQKRIANIRGWDGFGDRAVALFAKLAQGKGYDIELPQSL